MVKHRLKQTVVGSTTTRAWQDNDEDGDDDDGWVRRRRDDADDNGRWWTRRGVIAVVRVAGGRESRRYVSLTLTLQLSTLTCLLRLYGYKRANRVVYNVHIKSGNDNSLLDATTCQSRKSADPILRIFPTLTRRDIALMLYISERLRIFVCYYSCLRFLALNMMVCSVGLTISSMNSVHLSNQEL